MVVRRACACGGGGSACACPEQGEEPAVRRSPVAGTGRASSLPARRSCGGGATAPIGAVVRSSGEPLDAATRAFAEPAFGRSFDDVRVHSDAAAARSAAGVSARAYTLGSHIAFASGQYSPGTSEGRRLLVHELAHVAQQSTAAATVPQEPRLGDPHSPHEDEADRVAAEVLSGSGRAAGPATAPAPPVVQRACGPGPIGTPTGCAGVSGDVSGEAFLFVVNCDEFRKGPPYLQDEDARLEAFARTLDSGATVNIHGFASEEGDPTFNQNLSCARALAAQAIVNAANPGVATHLLAHGATAGDRDDRRSVVVDQTPAPPPDRPPPQLEPPPSTTCGPDVSDALAAVLASVRSTYAGWTPASKRRDACDTITSIVSRPMAYVMAWDISQLFLPNTGWLRHRPFSPPCGQPPAAAGGDVEDASTCSNTVQVGTGCYLAGTVNYALFGQICRLCNDEFGVLSESTMENLILAWKASNWIVLDFDDPGPPTAWARAGFHGYPGHHPTHPNRTNCVGRCLVPVPRTLFDFVWEPYKPR